MNLTVFLIESIVLVISFNLIIMVPLCKHPEWWIEDYPKDIQNKYFENHEYIPAKATDKRVVIKKGIAVIIMLFVFIVLVRLAGAYNFITGFGLSYGLWSVINWYDCFVMDFLEFSNLKKVRLPGTEDMDKEYHQKMYHFMQACKGAIIGLIPSILVGMVFIII